ncbi:putative G3BP-like protein isoform X1 [Abrus precatorius]|uniref:G3BP-like protein isoform X1 n=1 Tax=Abrus precatorius TaxID=3816 RepID=A0A8B8KUR2_ABRPR|nr:putative G3BP-like protein isoform X1 [Abrus precatorius]
MAVTDGSPTPQMVGNAFVEQYYSILHQDPDQVHRFYHESSVLSRPEEDGSMTTVTTTADINKKILSLDYTSFRVEILSADAQPSYKDGVMVVVTGCLMGSDNLKRKFSQSFFLAPQDKGYFVLNDVFRYIDEYKSIDIESVPANDADESSPTDSFTPEPEAIHVPEDTPPSQTAIVDADNTVSKEVSQPVENGKLSVTETVVPVNHVKESNHQEHHSHTEKAASNTQEDAPKKSFASIVNALKDNAAPFHIRTSPVKTVEQPRVSSVPVSEVPATSTDSPTEKSNENAGKAYAIFVANLPMNATVEQLERVFKKFGPIKPDGIQVRSNKVSLLLTFLQSSVRNLFQQLQLLTQYFVLLSSNRDLVLVLWNLNLLLQCKVHLRPLLRLHWTIEGFPLKKGELIMIGSDIHRAGVDSEMTEMITSGAVATLVVAVVAVVAIQIGMILRSEVSSLAGLEEAIMLGVAMEKLCQGVFRMEEKLLVNQ